MTSVERVFEYAQLPSEAPLETRKELKPPDNWPQHGVITGEWANYRYSEDGELVLKGLNFCIRAQEKVTHARLVLLINVLEN